MIQKSVRLKGYLVGILGGLLISPDALFSRLITVDLASLLFWRALFTFIGFFLIILFFYGRKTISLFKNWKYQNYIVMLAATFGPTGFVLGIKFTSVVNVLAIFAMTPISTTFISWLIWKKKPPQSTIISMIVALIGMSLVVLDGIQADQVTSFGQIQLAQSTLFGVRFNIPWGEIAVTIAMISTSLSFCVANAHAKINFLPSQCGGALFAALLLIPFNNVWLLDGYNLSLLLIAGFFVQSLAYACLIISAKYISSTESSLMLLIETIFGPILVWLFLREAPTLLALSGGLIILIALLSNIFFQLKNNHKTLNLENILD